jgi:hypothetical protein
MAELTRGAKRHFENLIKDFKNQLGRYPTEDEIRDTIKSGDLGYNEGAALRVYRQITKTPTLGMPVKKAAEAIKARTDDSAAASFAQPKKSWTEDVADKPDLSVPKVQVVEPTVKKPKSFWENQREATAANQEAYAEAGDKAVDASADAIGALPGLVANARPIIEAMERANTGPTKGLARAGLESGIRGLETGAMAAEALSGDVESAVGHKLNTTSIPSSEAYEKVTNAKTFGQAWKAFMSDPALVLTELTSESVGMLAPVLPAAVAVGATGGTAGIVGAAALSGLGSGSVETISGIFDAYQAENVDVTDADAMKEALQDPEKYRRIRNKALKKGIVVGVFDALSVGLAGKLWGSAGKTMLTKTIAGLGEVGVQAGLGMTGEALGSAFAGQAIQPGAVFAEGVGEIGPGSIQVGIGVMARNKNASPNGVNYTPEGEQVAAKAVADLTAKGYLDAPEGVAAVDTTPVTPSVVERDTTVDIAIPERNKQYFVNDDPTDVVTVMSPKTRRGNVKVVDADGEEFTIPANEWNGRLYESTDTATDGASVEQNTPVVAGEGIDTPAASESKNTGVSEVKQPWEMTPDELEEAIRIQSDIDKNASKIVFGEEGAKAYDAAQRIINSSTTDSYSERYKQASTLVEKMESNLTPEQERILFGIDETGPTLDELKAYKDQVFSIDYESPEAMGQSLRFAITNAEPGKNPAEMSLDGRTAYAKLRHAFSEAQKLGWDTQVISEAAIKAAAGRFKDPNDIELMLGKFINAGKKTTEVATQELPSATKALPEKVESTNVDTPAEVIQSQEGLPVEEAKANLNPERTTDIDKFVSDMTFDEFKASVRKETKGNKRTVLYVPARLGASPERWTLAKGMSYDEGLQRIYQEKLDLHAEYAPKLAEVDKKVEIARQKEATPKVEEPKAVDETPTTDAKAPSEMQKLQEIHDEYVNRAKVALDEARSRFADLPIVAKAEMIVGEMLYDNKGKAYRAEKGKRLSLLSANNEPLGKSIPFDETLGLRRITPEFEKLHADALSERELAAGMVEEAKSRMKDVRNSEFKAQYGYGKGDKVLYESPSGNTGIMEVVDFDTEQGHLPLVKITNGYTSYAYTVRPEELKPYTEAPVKTETTPKPKKKAPAMGAVAKPKKSAIIKDVATNEQQGLTPSSPEPTSADKGSESTLTKRQQYLLDLIRRKAKHPRPDVEQVVAEMSPDDVEVGIAEMEPEPDIIREPPKERYNPQEKQTIDSIRGRAGKDYQNYLREEDMPDDYDSLTEYLEDKHGINVEPDGLIRFFDLTPEVKKIVGDSDIVVYHYTSSAVLPDIVKEGLVSGKRDVNRHNLDSSGVYVTTEISGPAIEGYRDTARGVLGGEPVTLAIRTKIKNLIPDPDDADIESGRYQFVLPKVDVDDVINLSDVIEQPLPNTLAPGDSGATTAPKTTPKKKAPTLGAVKKPTVKESLTVEAATKENTPKPAQKPNLTPESESAVSTRLDAQTQDTGAGKGESGGADAKAESTPSSEYYIYHNEQKKYVPVEGKPVTIKGFKDSDFFVHKAIASDDYVVSEGRAGASVAHGKTEEAAIAAATKLLRRVGKEKFESSVDRTTSVVGVSPRHEGKYQPSVTFKVGDSVSTAQPGIGGIPMRITGKVYEGKDGLMVRLDPNQPVGGAKTMPLTRQWVKVGDAKQKAPTLGKPAKPLRMDGTTRPEPKAKATAPAFESLHPKSQEKFNSAWDSKDADGMNDLLHPDNRGLRAEFERRSGTKLPKAVGGTRQAVTDYFAKSEPVTIDKPVEVVAVKEPWEMSKAELDGLLANADTSVNATTTTIDWGSRRGQGKRSNGMVLGSMSDAPRGIQTRNDAIGKLPKEERREAHIIDNEYGGIDTYARARAIGLSHTDASILMYPDGGHQQIIKNALREGKTVPESVLADYPDLVKKPAEVAEPKPLTPEVKKTEPIKVYHGTRYGTFDDFDVSKADKAALSNHPAAELGVWFTDDMPTAERFATPAEYKHPLDPAESPAIYEATVDFTRPKVYDDFLSLVDDMDSVKGANNLRRQLLAQGYDGVIVARDLGDRVVRDYAALDTSKLETPTRRDYAKESATAKVDAKPTYGSENKGVTTDEYQEAVKKFGKSVTLGSTAIPTELLQAAVKVGLYHAEALAREGARLTKGAFTHLMQKDGVDDEAIEHAWVEVQKSDEWKQDTGKGKTPKEDYIGSINVRHISDVDQLRAELQKGYDDNKEQFDAARRVGRTWEEIREESKSVTLPKSLKPGQLLNDAELFALRNQMVASQMRAKRLDVKLNRIKAGVEVGDSVMAEIERDLAWKEAVLWEGMTMQDASAMGQTFNSLKMLAEAHDAVAVATMQDIFKPSDIPAPIDIKDPLPKNFFSKNKLFKESEISAARERLKAKAGRLNVGLPLDMIPDMVIIAGGYVEGAVRNLDGAFSKYETFKKKFSSDVKEEYGYDLTEENLLDIWEKTRQEADKRADALAMDPDFNRNRINALKRLRQLIGKEKVTESMTDVIRSIPEGDEEAAANFMFGTQRIKQLVGKDNVTDDMIEGFRDVDLHDPVAIAQYVRSHYSWKKAAKETAVDVANIPRTLLSMADFSAMYRQGGMLFLGENKAWVKAARDQFKVAFSEENYKALEDRITSHDYYPLAEESGLAINLGDKLRLAEREEAFVSRLINKVPVLGKVARTSERSYVGFLNSLRFNTFSKYAEMWGNEATAKDYEELAKFINAATGRGKLGGLEDVSAHLSSVFFSPRWIASRVQAPMSLASESPRVRKMASRNIVMFTSATLAGLMLLKAAGGDVEDDPRSSDFGKARFGNTRIDLTSGYQQYIRYAAQLMTGKAKTLGLGEVVEANRLKTLGRFGRTKLAPVPSLAVDALAGKTVMGEDVDFDAETAKRQGLRMITPIAAKDIIEAVKEHGYSGLAYAPPAVAGIGVQTFNANQNNRYAELLQRDRKTLDTLRALDAKKGDGESILFIGFGKNLTIDDKKTKLTRQQYQEYQQKGGEAIYKAVKESLANKDYQAESDEGKLDWLRYTINDARDTVLSDLKTKWSKKKAPTLGGGRTITERSIGSGRTITTRTIR